MDSGYLLQGFYLGVIIALTFYNLSIFVSLRDWLYLSYVGVVVCFAFTFIFPLDHQLLEYRFSRIGPGFIICGVFYAVRFLNLEKYQPARFLFIIVLLAIFNTGISFINPDLAHTVAFCLMASMGLAVSMIAAYFTFIIKYRPAIPFGAAWIMFSANLVSQHNPLYDTAGFEALTVPIYQMVNCLILLLLSFSLVDKVAYIKRSNEEAKNREQLYTIELNRLIDQQNSLLEEEVHRQTLELQNANKVKDKFFSIIAHDLRNPLHSLASFLSVIQTSVGKGLSKQDLLTIIDKLSSSVWNTIELTDNLLSWAKSQLEMDEIDITVVNVGEVITRCARELAGMAREKNITLDAEIVDGFVKADQNQLTFIVRNLLSNALKFTLPGGTVLVSATFDENKVVIVVRDSGIGLSEDGIKQLFDVSVKKNTTGTKGEKGSGLGLLLCKEFIERNHWDISVQSKLGQGTTFTITLPGIENMRHRISFSVKRFVSGGTKQ
jgi:two-component system, sensor histidine kinase LadS